MTLAGPQQDQDADVIVVGAGPGGSSAATFLARQGLDVLLLEKSEFPREKVCGDGLTPRAVRMLVRLGIDTSPQAGWLHNKGLRVYGARREPFDMPWPELADFPDYGLVCPRSVFDDLLAGNAVEAGARLHTGVRVTGPILHERSQRVLGVTDASGRSYRAPIVVGADGNSARLGVQLGREHDPRRPMGVAVRSYYTSPRHEMDWMESYLQLWDGQPGESNLLPGYGWVFRMGDGTVNAGLGMLNTSSAFGKTDYRDLMRCWLNNTPEEWGCGGEPAATHPRGRPADGVQPQAAVPGRVAPARRLWRHGQPVQRRGHQLRDESADGRPVDCRRARPRVRQPWC